MFLATVRHVWPAIRRKRRRLTSRCLSDGPYQRQYASHNRPHHKPLCPPTILCESNHLLVVHKPPGWHSMPPSSSYTGINDTDRKSIIHYWQLQRRGGGSERTFLLPLHRLDQPCSGVLLLAKTRRAASRIQSHWKQVKKLYVCVLDEGAHTHRLVQASQPGSDGEPESLWGDGGGGDDWMELSGYQEPTQQRRAAAAALLSMGRGGATPPLKGWSVRMTPLDGTGRPDAWGTHGAPDEAPGPHRRRTIRWRFLDKRILAVETNQGSRHMIRSLLGMVGCPIAGDLRYGATDPLPDRSVALHAHALQLPDDLPLGRQHAASELRTFVAAVPMAWDDFFAVRHPDWAVLAEIK